MRWRERLSMREASGAVTLIFTVLAIQVVIFLFNLPDKKVKREVSVDTMVGRSGVAAGSGTDSVQRSVQNSVQRRRQDSVQNSVRRGRQDGVQDNGQPLGVAIALSGAVYFGEVFEFDPNTVTAAGLVRLGLSDRQAATIINYRSKGGVFRKREDFRKMYVVSDEFYDRVKDFIVISEQDNRTDRKGDSGTVSNGSRDSGYAGSVADKDDLKSDTQKDRPVERITNSVLDNTPGENLSESGVPEKRPSVLELNRADSLDLLDLPGIGPYYASKIIRYRDRIGGFISKEQLKEISGIDEERYSLFEERVYADTAFIYRADLNLVTVEELSSNPYIGSYLSRAIIRFREQSGEADIKALFENRIIDRRKYELLRYYFL